MKIAALADYWRDKADAAYKRYADEPKINDGRAWARGPSANWIEYQRCSAEIGNCLMPFERLSGRRWDRGLGGITDTCWRPS